MSFILKNAMLFFRSDLEAVSVRWEVVSSAEIEETEKLQAEFGNGEGMVTINPTKI